MQAAGIGGARALTRLTAVEHKHVTPVAGECAGNREPDDATADHQHLRVAQAFRSGRQRWRIRRVHDGGHRLRIAVAGERRCRHWLHRRAWRGEARFAARGDEPRDGRPAHPPLTTAHPGASRLLERGEAGCALARRMAQRTGRHLLAAADGHAVGDRVEIEGGRREDAPKRALERLRPTQRAARIRGVGRRETKVARSRKPGEPPPRERHARPAERRAVSDREHLRHAGASFGVGFRFQPPEPLVHEVLRAAKCPGETRLRLEAEVQRRDIGCDAALAPGRRDVERGKAAFALTGDELRAPDHRHAGTLQRAEISNPVEHQIGRCRDHGQRIAPRGQARLRRRLHDGRDAHTAGEKFAGQLQVERTAAPDHDACAGRDALRARQRLQGAGRHHAG